MAIPQFILSENANFDVTASQGTSGLYRLTVTITPKEGYLLDVSDGTKYVFTYYNTSSKTNTQSTVYNLYENQIVLRANYFSVTYNPTLDFSEFPVAISQTPKVTINNNIEKSDLTSEQEGNNFTFAVSVGANVFEREKYQFETVPVVNFTGLDGAEHTVNFSPVVDFLQYSVTIENVDTTQEINISGKIAKLLEVRQTLTNANILNIYPVRVFADSVLNVTIKSDTNFYFEDVPFLRCFGEIYNFTLSDIYTAVLNIDLSTVQYIGDVDYITIIATGKQEILPPSIVNVHENLINCRISDMQPPVIYDNSEIYIKVVAFSGYYFADVPKITVHYTGGVQDINFTLTDTHTGEISVNLSDLELSNISDIYISAFADVETEYKRNYGAIEVYKVDNEILSDFAEKRFFSINETTGEITYIDLGKYVISLHRVFCEVGQTAENNIICGNYDTEIKAVTPVNDLITLNFGAVMIPNYNNSSVDYNSEITIFLPFFGFRNITSDFVGKEISLEYVINIVTGTGYVKLICDGIIFDNIAINAKANIMYRSYEYNLQSTTIGQNDFSQPNLQGLQPYIIVKYFNDINENIYTSDCLRTELNNVTGYAEITELTNFVSDSITTTEKEMLLQLLSNGVTFAPSTL